MMELSWLELLVLLLAVGFVIVASGGARVCAMLLTVFGTLGFLLILIAVVFLMRSMRTQEITHAAILHTHQIHEIPLDDSDVLPQTVSRATRIAEPPTAKANTVSAAQPVAEPGPAPAEVPVRIDEPIRIDEQTRAEIERQWREDQLHTRLRYTGTGVATLLCLLATAFSYLQLDMLSGAKHRRSLQAAAGGVILVVALAAVLTAEGRLGF